MGAGASAGEALKAASEEDLKVLLKELPPSDIVKLKAAVAECEPPAAAADSTPPTKAIVGASVSEMESGTKFYMSLYPEGSTDAGLRLGNIVPDFSCDTTAGHWDSFHEWKKGKWAILFSHPADFTPVCTTEIGRLALKYDELSAMDCLVATLSVDPVRSHEEWLKDVVAHCENNIEIKFPIIGDADRSISMKYGMIDPGTSGDQSLPLTIRAVFIVNPENKLMLVLNYPACVGRSMDEIVRCVKALQLSYEKSVATPANWPNNHADIPIGDGRTTEFKGSVFLLPTVSEEEAKANYPNYHTCPLPSEKAYLRLVKLDELSGSPAKAEKVEEIVTTGSPAKAEKGEELVTTGGGDVAAGLKPNGSSVSKMESGTKFYMSLYPEGSTDAGLRLGNIVPDFSCDTTAGHWDSFHEWKKGKWAILFSHPADFTPVCTTEIGRLALKYDELSAMDCLVATLSVDPVRSHEEWLKDVVAHCENNIEIKFPIIGDADRSISMKYGMIDPGTSGDQSLPLTIRAVFIVNPENKLMLVLNYPACVGRSMDEIVRCVKALQLSYEKSVATPANWPNNHADIPIGDGRTTEFKGSVFLLPTVSEEEAKANYPDYHTCPLPSEKAYLRLVKLDDLTKESK